ncbi:MAG TPA: hypothetical protein VL201_02585 [Patescibacteria group bacterium]|jgi:hypothetical protein|nr:hypothetical protein [Patescibacteria group bacterium]
MKAYCTLLQAIFLAGLGCGRVFGMDSSRMNQDSFERIETDLRVLQEKAIANIHTNFPLIPNDEWHNVRMNINLAREKTRKLLCIDYKKQYYFQPKLDQNFKNQILSKSSVDSKENVEQSLSSVFNLKKEYSLERFALVTRMCMMARDIKPGTVIVENFSDKKGGLALAKTGSCIYKWSFLRWCWKLSQISREQCIVINWLRFKRYFDRYADKEYAMLQVDVLNHELTHLIEAHAAIHGILIHVVKEYYPHINPDTHLSFINLQKAHELIAEVVPRMLLFCSALLEEKKNYKAPSNIHPSSADLKPWIQRIITCYEKLL